MRSRAATIFTALVLPVVVLTVIAGGVRASCGASGSDDPVAIERAQIGNADVVVEGVFQPGPTHSETLLSPARLRVTRYVKGSGAGEVLVETGIERHGDVMRATSTGIGPRAGEPWRVYGRAAGDMLSTNACTGSARIDAAPGTPAPTPVRGSGNRLLLPIVMTAAVVILAASVIPISRKLLR